MKFCILIIFKEILLEFFFVMLANHFLTRFIETGYLIENFENDWYSTTNMLEVSTWEIV